LGLADELDRAEDLLDHARRALDRHIRRHCCLTHEGAAAPEEKPQFST
jgi:hypothetical protein